MKPIKATISDSEGFGNVFLFREISSSTFAPEFHFHEECQLAFIIEGTGKRIVGDSVDHFEDNELVFIGSNVPHVWFNANSTSNEKARSNSLSLFISPKMLLNSLNGFGNINEADSLFKKAQRGMYVTGDSKKKIVQLLKNGATQHGIEQIISILQMIHILSITTEFSFLASSNYSNKMQFKDNDRMNKVYTFLMENFKKGISLAEVADVARMNPHAFCRFFKSRTQKSLTQFVNEIRVGHACKLLTDKNESITQIAFECGFNNVSNFNRCFKMMKKISPREYRNQIM